MRQLRPSTSTSTSVQLHLHTYMLRLSTRHVKKHISSVQTAIRPSQKCDLRHSSSSNSTHVEPTPQIIFSGIQPTGVPHLGNYLGALRQWVDLQNTAPPTTKLLYSIVDLHALTSRQPPLSRRHSRRQVLAALLAIGLDSTRCTIFHQSAVPQHSELHWILSCDASMGWLSRMRQWQSKTSDEDIASMLRPSPNPKSTERVKLGLFAYPVLQAADILVHRATRVPVGEDQVQHLEFARNCANVFNHAYKTEVLIPPETLVGEARRVMSLTEPGRKMSKSDGNPRSMILLSDGAEDIAKKFRVALTDSIDGITYEPERRPGIANLIDILSFLNPEGQTPRDIARDCKDMSLRVLKEKVATSVNVHLMPIREKYEWLLGEKDGRTLDEIAAQGAAKASKSAEDTMRLVRDAVGL